MKGLRMKAALIDPCQEFCRTFQKLLLSGFGEERMFLIVASFSNLEEFFLTESDFDVYFIALEPFGQEGFERLEQLRKEYAEGIFILLGDDGERMQEAFFHRPFGFIRKSDLNEDTERTLFYLKREFGIREKKAVLFDGKKEYIVKPSEIMYCHSVEHYVCLHYVGRNRKLEMLRMKLQDAENILEPFGFARIHRNYLVNLSYAEKLKDGKIILVDGNTELAVSRRMYKAVERTVENWKTSRDCRK